MKIYIMGSTGVGKSTLSRILSVEYGITCFELDKIVYDQNNKQVHRSDADIMKDFNKIIRGESWIIEDIGRERFSKGREVCDYIYYIEANKLMIYFQMIKRWLGQRFNNNDYNVKPTFKNLRRQLGDVCKYKKIEKGLLKSLEPYKEKMVFVKRDDIKRGKIKLPEN